jgi:hypothetical protein
VELNQSENKKRNLAIFFGAVIIFTLIVITTWFNGYQRGRFDAAWEICENEGGEPMIWQIDREMHCKPPYSVLDGSWVLNRTFDWGPEDMLK